MHLSAVSLPLVNVCSADLGISLWIQLEALVVSAERPFVDVLVPESLVFKVYSLDQPGLNYPGNI